MGGPGWGGPLGGGLT